MEQERLSYCRICAAACGIVVTVDDERVVRVRGDAGHPVSGGYVCSKGRGISAWHHATSRLDRPRLRGSDVGWDHVLDDLAGSLGATITADGPDAVALYLATGLAYDAAGQIAAATWLPSIGSRSFYTAVTVDNAPVLVAAELVTGHAMLNPVWDPTSPGLLLLVGTNPVVSHGYGTALPDPIRHLRDFKGRGGRVWVLDPRRTESAALADEHVAVRPGADVAVLAAVAGALLADGADALEVEARCVTAEITALRGSLEPFTVSRAARVADVDEGVIEQLIAEVRGSRGRLAIQCGTGPMMAPDGIVVEWLRWVLLILSGSLDRSGGMRFNRGAVNRLRPPHAPVAPRPTEFGAISRPELPRVLGQLPAVAMVDEIEAGRCRALLVTGGNPITAFPEPARMRRALQSLETFVVVDVMESELTQLATHVLPATGQLERADLTLAEATSVRSGIQATRPVVAPVAQRRPVWWMLASLSRRMGRDALGGVDPDVMTDEAFLRGVLARSPLDATAVFDAGPRGTDVEIEHGWVRGSMLAGGRWHIAPDVLVERLDGHADPNPELEGSLVLAPRREMGWSNSVRYGGAGLEPVARVHPSDAARCNVSDGAHAVVTSPHGSIRVVVAVEGNVRAGVVSVTHGHADQSPGELTSSRAGVDPLTTMPHASGLPVTLAPDPTI